MNEYYRIIDVNLNRLSEALRTIEEIARFKLNDKVLTEKLKKLRHEVSNLFEKDYFKLLNARDSQADFGPTIPNDSVRDSFLDIIKANFKRSQQAVRVLEEYSKLINIEASHVFESIRYELYTLEKIMGSNAVQIYKTKRLENRKLYLVTDRSKFDNDDTFFEVISSAIKGGVSIVQLREKDASTKEFLHIARIVKEICNHQDAIFIINDRVDIAMAVNADGVHLGQDDMDIKMARKLLGDVAIIGNSTHKPDDAVNAVNNGADYIGVGPVFTTPTKPGRSAVGYEYVTWASKNVTIPFFAIGGINISNINEVIKAGASRVAVVREIMNADNPELAAQKLLNNTHLTAQHMS